MIQLMQSAEKQLYNHEQDRRVFCGGILFLRRATIMYASQHPYVSCFVLYYARQSVLYPLLNYDAVYV